MTTTLNNTTQSQRIAAVLADLIHDAQRMETRSGRPIVNRHDARLSESRALDIVSAREHALRFRVCMSTAHRDFDAALALADLERIAAEDAEHMSPRKEVQIKHAMQRVADAS